MKEIFKTVVFRNKTWSNYEVSNFGRVRSIDRFNSFIGANQSGKYKITQKIKGKVLTPRINKDGYAYITLCENGNNKSAKIHRLVAETFIDNPFNKPAINHLDENKQNNMVDNLEWCTTKENNRYGSRGLRFNKITVLNPDGYLYKEFNSLREASAFLGISRKTIMKFCNNEKQLFRVGGKNTYFKDYTFICKEGL